MTRSNAMVVQKNGKVYIDPSDKNTGNLNNALVFGSYNGTLEGIASKRNAGGNAYGLDLYTVGIPRLSITNSGLVGIGTIAPDRSLIVYKSGDAL